MSEHERGKLKIFMGYAAGVGKTYTMLEEAQQRKAAGIDVVIGYFEPHGRKGTIEKTDGLEIIPRKNVEYRGSVFEEMDTDTVLARRPELCIVDEFPHTNVPGSDRAKRWEDVETLLVNGIDVSTTMNIQHLESLNDQVWQISGIRVRETVPDWVVEQADEVIMVDLTPRALLHRLQRGVVYERGKAEQALQNFFRESTLVALRELALRQTAYEVGQRMSSGEHSAEAPYQLSRHPHKHQKILVLVTANPKTAMLIRRAKRMSDFVDAECFAVAVQPTGDLSALPQAEREAMEKHLNFARNLHIETRVLEGEDVAAVLVDFARRNQITQIYLTRPRERNWLRLFSSDPAQKIISLASDMQIVIVSDREQMAHRTA
jgi:two-component system sensor histidine kinase KdpD